MDFICIGIPGVKIKIRAILRNCLLKCCMGMIVLIAAKSDTTGMIVLIAAKSDTTKKYTHILMCRHVG